MTSLIPNLDGPGWIEDPKRIPKACRLGHPYLPNSYRRGNELGEPWFYCLNRDHPDDDSRWRNKPGIIQMNCADGTVMG